MKGGTPYRLRGKLLFLMLSVLICITIFLLAWEKTPLVTSLLSVQDQFAASYSDILVDSSGSPTQEIRQKGHGGEDLSDEVATRETTNEQGQDLSVQPTGYVTKHLTNSTENIRNLTTSTEKKDILVDSSGSAAQEISQKGHGGEDFSDEVATRETSNEQGQDLSMQPTGSATKNLTKSIESISSLTTSAEEKVCNYAKGKWVADGRRPLYSGFGCKRWLSGMWACRLTQRTDFSYEGFRWQPQNCEMPDFEASAFLRRMKDKTLAFVGDSLGRQQFQSLMCMASGGKDSPEVQDVGWEYGLVKARGAIRPDGWAYRFPTTNTTILYYWSASLCDLEPLNVTDPATYFAMHLDRPAAFLRRYLSRFDVLVLNTGHHWNRGKLNANRWVMHLNGMPIKDKKLAQIGNAKNFAVSSVIKWVNSQLPLHPRLKAFFRTISPRHFSNGDWDSGGRCDNTTPLSRGAEVTKDESSHPVVENAVKGTGVKILDITALSELRDEGHISRYSIKATEGVNDCLHWCLPGIPDTWNELLFAQL